MAASGVCSFYMGQSHPIASAALLTLPQPDSNKSAMQAAIAFPDISPFVWPWPVFGYVIPLRWYALAYIVGILIGWRIAVAALRRPDLWRDNTPVMTLEQLENLLTWIVVGVIAGGRIGYVLFYKPAYYLANPIEIPVLWNGGMSFHGGFLGVVLAVYVYARAKKLPLGSVADTVAISALPAVILVRIANFINAELWGRPTDLPWGVIFPGDAAQNCGALVGLCARHPSQLYESALEGVVLGTIIMILAFRRKALKTPWRLSGVFFAGYGIARFIVEFVRQPDAQFQTPGNPLGLFLHLDGYGLTMGQTLSLPMIVIGIAVIAYTRKPR
jgi:phosphatidylglycerol:prolipoprotein diacylglycerol transferase